MRKAAKNAIATTIAKAIAPMKMRFVPVWALHQSRARTGYDATDVVRRSKCHLGGARERAPWVCPPWPVPPSILARCFGYYRPGITRCLSRLALQASMRSPSHREGGPLGADRGRDDGHAGEGGQAVEKGPRG